MRELGSPEIFGEQNRTEQRLMEICMNPLSPTFKMRRLLKEICPVLKGANSMGTMTWSDQGPTVRIRESFEDFILKEMD